MRTPWPPQLDSPKYRLQALRAGYLPKTEPGSAGLAQTAVDSRIDSADQAPASGRDGDAGLGEIQATDPVQSADLVDPWAQWPDGWGGLAALDDRAPARDVDAVFRDYLLLVNPDLPALACLA